MAACSVINADLIAYLRGNRWLAQNGFIPKAHAIVCDPPYGLEFMGKEWDKFGSSLSPFSEKEAGGLGGYKTHVRYGNGLNAMNNFQAWVTEWAELLLDYVHPGAVGMFFGGTRTYHRLAAGLEDAGWEIADSIVWCYGCLSEDTEILTEDGWVLYHKAIEGTRVLCYNVEHDTYTWQPIQDRVVYEYADTAYRIVSDRTDQLVSRNHRCLVERGGKLVFRYAETLQSEERVPVLENLPEVRGRVSMRERDADQAQSVLQSALCGQSIAQKTAGRGTGADAVNVRGLRQAVLQAECVGSQGERTSLQSGVQWQNAIRRTDTAFQQGAGGVDGSVDGVLYREDDRREQSGMEGRRYILPKARQLQADQVRALSAGIYAYGTQRRLRDGASLDRRAGYRALSAALGGGASHQPRSTGQSARQPRIVRLEPGTQTLRSARNTPTDLARVEPVHYVGKVWCVRVPTGAFVARRNGKMFVTGNSGFPKSANIGKLIDKEAGAVREVVGNGPYTARRPRQNVPSMGVYHDDVGAASSALITAPATPLAARWEGHGTALKPAYEPVVICRAPRGKRTYAALAREFGTGALAVDAGRIGTDIIHSNGEGAGGLQRQAHAHGIRPYVDGLPHVPTPSEHVGRWPANFALVCECDSDDHADGCPVRVLGEQSGELRSGDRLTSHNRNKPRLGNGGVYGNDAGTSYPQDCHGDAGTAARFFYTAKAATWEREAGLDERERAFLPTMNDGIGNRPHNPEQPTAWRANVHPTVKPIRIAEYLARLALPPAGDEPRRLLIPFAGSGSEMIGAALAGWDVITGIERETEYADIARARLAWWSKHSSYEAARKAYSARRKTAHDAQIALPMTIE